MKQVAKDIALILWAGIKAIGGMCLVSAILVSIVFLLDKAIALLAIEAALCKTAWVYLHFLIIIGIYFIVKAAVPVIRIKNRNAANMKERILFYLSSLVIVILVIHFLGSYYPEDLASQDLKVPTKSETYTNIIFTLLIILPPYLLGIHQGLIEDSKMTFQEKLKMKMDAERSSAGEM